MDELRIPIFVAGCLAVIGVVSCATSPNSAGDSGREESSVQGQPPERDPPESMPEGPDVKVRAGSQGGREGGEGRHRRADPPVRTGDSGRTYVREAEIESLLERGPSYLFQVVAVEPVERGGTFAGYRIVEVAAEAREKMEPKLRVGDVVTEINGIPIERPDDYMAAWKKLKHRAVLEVEYRRDREENRALWYVRERVDEAIREEDSSGGRR